MSDEEVIERLLREFVEHANMSERLARVEATLAERARLEDREHAHEFRTQSGNWNVEAILAVQQAQQNAKKKTSIPPAFRALSTMMDSAGGKVGALIGAALVTWLIEHLPAILRAAH